MVDTLPHEPPLDSSLFRPETRKGPPAGWSLLAGVLVGAAAVALPAVLSNQEVGGRQVDGRPVGVHPSGDAAPGDQPGGVADAV